MAHLSQDDGPSQNPVVPEQGAVGGNHDLIGLERGEGSESPDYSRDLHASLPILLPTTNRQPNNPKIIPEEPTAKLVKGLNR